MKVLTVYIDIKKTLSVHWLLVKLKITIQIFQKFHDLLHKNMKSENNISVFFYYKFFSYSKLTFTHNFFSLSRFTFFLARQTHSVWCVREKVGEEDKRKCRRLMFVGIDEAFKCQSNILQAFHSHFWQHNAKRPSDN